MPSLFDQPKILSLSELTAGIARVFSENFPNSFWIKAELAKLNHYPESGHCYPSLVEKEKGTIRAEIRGTIWANDFMRINQKFMQVTREPLKEGIHILFRATVKYHPVYGLSLQISDIDPTYTLGEMAREKLETINRLKQEGIFDSNRQLQFPLLPQRIAIISVKTSKGFSDFMSILKGNQWGYAFTCYLFPALLQGDKAVESILGQFRAIATLKEHFDVVVIIRGGGGDVGLNCYDNYSLSREVALFPLPVLSGIGHSTNETVVEMVSGRNMITPTDLAYFLIQQFHNFSVKLQEMADAIVDFSSGLMEEMKRGQEELARKLSQGSMGMMGVERSRLELMSRDLASSAKDSAHDQRLVLHEMESRFRIKPLQALKVAAGMLNRQAALLELQARQLFVRQGMKIGQAENQLRILDPVNVLKRGFSITYSRGKILRDASEVSPGDEITTKLYSGALTSEIKSKSS